VIEQIIGLLLPNADEYAESIYPVISAEKLPGDVLSYNARCEPLRVNPNLDDATVDKIMSDSDALIRNALNKKD